MDDPSTSAPPQQTPAPGHGMDFDALYAAPTPAQQEHHGGYMGGLGNFAVPAARQPDLVGDPFAAPIQSTGLPGVSILFARLRLGIG